MDRITKRMVITFVLLATTFAFGQTTQVMYLSGTGSNDTVDWEFYCTAGRNSGQWTTIPVPSNWELQDFGGYNYGHDRPKSSEQGRYKLRFDVPDSWKNMTVELVFEGVMTDCEAKINGQSCGPRHQGGFYRFKYDVTELLKSGQSNLLEVTVDKVSANRSVEAAERQADYWVFGGIYRPVYLQAKPRKHIERIAIDAKADGSFRVDTYLANTGKMDSIHATISGPGIERQDIAPIEVAGEMVTIAGKIENVKPWTAETPNLYDLTLSLSSNGIPVHVVTERFGFRTFEVRPGDGLYLNGQKIRLKGVDRHSFWPESGRCLNRGISYDDVRLIKSMNMNAVRMSHYPPDTHFLDVCDELGLYVLDELAGWQKPPYDTEIGKKLVKEMVPRDVSHPCILFWDNANEGGWNRDLDAEFALYDPQQRKVLHPWEYFNGVDTDHYESFASTQRKLNSGNLFMPTEFLHGLYDGGHGAGLEDHWNLMFNSPMGAGGFLWCLVDEGVVRTDQDGKIDTDGNHAPDGIVGPYRQKEASYYTIKEIWSPIHIALDTLPADFDGQLVVENRYEFTNLKDCRFEWQLAALPNPWDRNAQREVLKTGIGTSPEVGPGQSGGLRLNLPEDRADADVLCLTAYDPTGMEVWTWSWPLRKGCETCHEFVQQKSQSEADIRVINDESAIVVHIDGLELRFDKKNGELASVKKNGRAISFGNGPRALGGESRLVDITSRRDKNDTYVEATYEGVLRKAVWKIYPSGWIRFDCEYELQGEFDLMGVTFDYPEQDMRAMRWVGRGPYRVWKNRMRGGKFDIWDNTYKDHVPGVTWDFPEFRGYYREWRAVMLTTTQGEIRMLNGTDDLFLGLYRPKDGPSPANTKVDVPDTGIALLHGIPAIGTKFQKPAALGPQGGKNKASGRYKATVCFYFDAPQ